MDPWISKQGGGARSRCGRILSTKICFYAPSHIPYVFVRRVVNNIHIINTACWLKSMYLRIYNENLQKRVPFFFKWGGGGAGPGIRTRLQVPTFWISYQSHWLVSNIHSWKSQLGFVFSRLTCYFPGREQKGYDGKSTLDLHVDLIAFQRKELIVHDQRKSRRLTGT